jgi:c-di-GMP-binding flagellar brake protein YcgR
MGMTTPFPEPDSPALEPFMVYARVEILAMLRQLLEQGVLVTAYCGPADGGGARSPGSDGFAVTVLLAVNPEFEEAVFDNASDARAQRRLLAAERLTFVAFIHQVKVQFSTHRAEPTLFEGRPAFRVRVPDALLRLQRREAFRVRTPLSRPAHCLVPYSEDGRQYEKLRLLDISVGGMALLTYPEKFDLTAGTTIEGCYLDLPGVGSVGVAVRIRHVDAVPRDEKARRAGCEFVSLAPQARLALQRYVNLLDAESRKVAGARAA